MRKIALLSLMVFAAACGSSDPAPVNGYIRVANLAPDAPAVDFCVASSGGTDSAPVMAAKNAANGLVYDTPGSSATAGSKQISAYFAYPAGTYIIKIFLKADGGSCANPLATASNVVINGGDYKTIALEGYTNAPANLVPHAANVFTDEVSVATTAVALRFVNASLLYVTAQQTYTPGPNLDIGFTAGGLYTKLFSNLAYPGVAAASPGGVDANGYLTIPSTGLPSTISLTVCQAGVAPPSPVCASTSVPPGQIQGGIVATAYLIGPTDVPPAADSRVSGALLCGDVVSGTTIVPSAGNYSACTSSL
jgi:Domain of unknown function (DUF4397)